MTRALAFLALVLVACGGAPEEQAPLEAEPVVVAATPELGVIVLSPSAELLDFATNWAERWGKATDRRIVVGEGGHVIGAQDEVLNDSGRRLCGGTRLSTGVRVARLQAATCPGMYETLGHELGHLLGADGHAAGGIMSVSSDAQPINAEALDLVCVNMTCPVMTPEF